MPDAIVKKKRFIRSIREEETDPHTGELIEHHIHRVYDVGEEVPNITRAEYEKHPDRLEPTGRFEDEPEKDNPWGIDVSGLDNLLKDELFDLADEMGLDYESKILKNDLINLIRREIVSGDWYGEVDLSTKKKDELLSMADEMGVEYDSKILKNELVELLEDRLNS